MIWFTCKSCGKTHSRPENSAGTLVFCTCGQGVTVPWESTMEAPPTPEPSAQLPPALPRWDPVPVGEERGEAPPPVVLPAPRKKNKAPRKRDKRFCFNHEDLASVKACASCGEAFCADCVVEFQGKTMCGPCKNFGIKLAQKPPKMSGRALAALILSLVSGPLVFLPLVAGGTLWTVVLSVMALIPQFLAAGLAGLALADTERNPRIHGRAVAVTAALASILFLLLSGFLGVMGTRQV